MSETKRTLLLLLLLAIAIGFIWWTQNNYATNFTDDLSRMMILAAT